MVIDDVLALLFSPLVLAGGAAFGMVVSILAACYTRHGCLLDILLRMDAQHVLFALDQLVDDVLVVLEFVELLLFQVHRYALVIFLVVIEQVSGVFRRLHLSLVRNLLHRNIRSWWLVDMDLNVRRDQAHVLRVLVTDHSRGHMHHRRGVRIEDVLMVEHLLRLIRID